jgi:hypothetical protein
MNYTTSTYSSYSKKRNLNVSKNLNFFHRLWGPPKKRSIKIGGVYVTFSTRQEQKGQRGFTKNLDFRSRQTRTW